MQQIVDVQFFGPTESISNIEFHLELGWPRILLQLSDAQYSTMTIELSTPTVDGGRVFELNSHGPGHLVGRGVADLLTLFATVADLHGSSEEDTYFETMDRRARELGSVAVREDRGSWSRSWLEAEGYDEAWLQPKGPTHTIAAFETERRDHWPLSATIQGSLRVTGGVGGSIHGTLSDDSGSIDLVLADRIPSAGLGPDRRIEVEVETTGPPDDELPGADPTIRVVAVRPLNPERD